MTDQSPTQTAKPWPREKLDLHVTQRIREQVDVALVLYRNDDDGLEAMLREGGEDAVWPRSWHRYGSTMLGRRAESAAQRPV